MTSQFLDREVGRVLRCRVAGQTFAVDLGRVAGIHRAGEAAAAGAGSQVVRLAARLGLPEGDGAGRTLVAIRSLTAPWGLVVDQVAGAVTVPAEQRFPLQAVSPVCADAPFREVLLPEQGMLLALDLTRVGPAADGDGDLVPAPRAAFPAQLGEGQIGGRIVLFTPTGLPTVGRPLRAGLSVRQVLEVSEPLPVLPVPTAPAFVRGLVRWRDWPVPVLDLGQRLGLSANSREPAGRLLIARLASTAALVGIPVRTAVSVRPLPLRHAVSTRSLPVPEELLLGTAETADETVFIPNLEAC